MHCASLVLALPLLVGGHSAARCHPEPVRWNLYVPWAIISLFGFLVCFIMAPVVQAGILLVTLLIWPYVRQRIRTLETLRRGGTLVVGPADGRARMLGALRCGRQWVGCRGGHRGDLLGAFSHTLRAIPDRS